MRPFILDPFFRPLQTLPGIGPRNGALLEKLVGGPKILDLLSHLPIDVIDRRFAPALSSVPDGRIITVPVTVGKNTPNARKSQPYRVRCFNETGEITLTFFHAKKDWLQKQLPEGKTVIISGKAEHYHGTLQMTHPDYMVPPARKDEIDALEPVYPLTQGITNKLLRKAIKTALEKLKPLPEWLDQAHSKKETWPGFLNALKALHFPENASALKPENPSRRRLAYDELLANQLTLALVRNEHRRESGRAFTTQGELRDKFIQSLPFALTDAQKNALKEIDADMNADYKMLRLLQGDVGSGKTVVACLAMLSALQSGTQAAIMAPTEILARQHYETFKNWLGPLGIRLVVLTGRDKGRARETLLQQIRSGAAQIVIGTHALFQKTVTFNNLGLAVIDEQHRFGVHQRLGLSEKSKNCDILVMTATPIPRTLTLTAYGDMEVSKITEKPPGRQPVDTLLIPSDKLDNMIEGLQRQIKTGARIYWVCPLVEESEVMDLAAAEERYDILKSHFGDRTGLMHGRMTPAEKDDVMAKFIAGGLDILVSTTVIEVGVNVPEASVMIIEHAERFGLAQLHQLRGRVGRGSKKSYCFLLYYPPLSEQGKERLSVMRQSEDGFVIAEKDLELRGAGEVLGIRQSGMANFHFADLTAHGDLLKAANDDAKLILNRHLHETGPRAEGLKTLLYLFDMDQGIQYLRSG